MRAKERALKRTLAQEAVKLGLLPPKPKPRKPLTTTRAVAEGKPIILQGVAQSIRSSFDPRGHPSQRP